VREVALPGSGSLPAAQKSESIKGDSRVIHKYLSGVREPALVRYIKAHIHTCPRGTRVFFDVIFPRRVS